MNFKLLITGLVLSLSFWSCSKEEDDDNNNNNPPTTITIPAKTVTGTAQTYSPMTTGLIPWTHGDCVLQARLSGSSEVVGTGSISANGAVTITYKATLSSTPFQTFQSSFSLSSGITYSPANGSMMGSVKHYIIKSNGDEKEVAIHEFSNNMPNVAEWTPVAMTQQGSIDGIDLLGNTWSNCSFIKGWNFLRMVYDVPTVGKATYECYATPQSSAVWYTYP